MIQKMVLSIKTTAACQLHCSFCPVVPWMKSREGWQTTLQDITDLIYYTQKAGYHYKRIIYSGGEPLLWDHLKKAAKLIKESGITDDTFMYTNGLSVTEKSLPEFKEICGLIDNVGVSSYSENQDNIKLILAENIPNVSIIKRERYFEIQEKPVLNSFPANCGCKALGMIGNKITLCSFQDHLIAYKKWNPEDFKDQTVLLKENYLKPFEVMNPFIRDMCAYCIGNLKVKAWIMK